MISTQPTFHAHLRNPLLARRIGQLASAVVVAALKDSDLGYHELRVK